MAVIGFYPGIQSSVAVNESCERRMHLECTVVIGHPGTGVFGGRGRRRGTEERSRATSEARARRVKLSTQLRANQCQIPHAKGFGRRVSRKRGGRRERIALALAWRVTIADAGR